MANEINTKQNIPDNDINSLQFAFDILKENIFLTLKVCLPVVVTNYNAQNNTVDVQPALQAVMADNTYKEQPQIFSVPVISLGGNGLSIRIPLKKGDTGIIVCCDRDITLFMQEYKKNSFTSTQPQTLRKHDLADGIFIPSTFGKITPNETSDIVIQNESGSVKFVLSSNGIGIKGDITVDGTITSSGDITSNGDVKAGNISLQTHKHPGVQTGSGTTGTPV